MPHLPPGPGLKGLRRLCVELGVSTEDQKLSKVRLAPALTLRERNVKVCDSLRLTGWVPVDGSSPFTRTLHIMDKLELSIKGELPPGDQLFFPFAPSEFVSGARSQTGGGWEHLCRGL